MTVPGLTEEDVSLLHSRELVASRLRRGAIWSLMLRTSPSSASRTLNSKGAAYLLGHPSFCGQLRNIRFNFNYIGETFSSPFYRLFL